MTIPPVNAAVGGFNVTGPEWQVGGVSDVAPAGGQGGGSFGGVLAQQLSGLQSVQDDAAKASQALATGQASDVSSVVMSVERARLAMQLASTLRNKAVESLQDIFHTQV